jgi:Flp pilus assembly protein TadD
MSLRALLLVLPIALTLASSALAQSLPTRKSNAREIEKTAPAAAQAYSRTAIAAMARGDLDAAERDFKKVLLLVPDNVPTTLNLGLLSYRRKDYKQAESLLKKVTRVEPENGLPWLMLGVIYYDQENLDAALAALAQAVLYAPKDARAHHFLGVTVGKKGWYSAAEDELRKALALDPEYGEAHFNLAAFYLHRNPPAIELARRHYEKAVDLGGARDPAVEKRLAGEDPESATPTEDKQP